MRLALAAEPEVMIVAECEDGLTAVEAIVQHAPDVVLLDVQMPGLDGFGVIDRIGVDAMPSVIFVTAFDAHAIRAFEVHAMDYVLKPFDDARLLATLARARTQLVERQHGALGRRLADVMRSWNDDLSLTNSKTAVAPPPTGTRSPMELSGHEDGDEESAGTLDEPGAKPALYLARFAVRGDDSVRFIPVTEVDWIEADRNYIVVHAGDANHRVRASLSHVTERLDPRLFVRIHRSIVVQADRIREVQPWFGGDYVAILRDGTKLRVSRQRAPHLLRPLA